MSLCAEPGPASLCTEPGPPRTGTGREGGAAGARGPGPGICSWLLFSRSHGDGIRSVSGRRAPRQSLTAATRRGPGCVPPRGPRARRIRARNVLLDAGAAAVPDACSERSRRPPSRDPPPRPRLVTDVARRRLQSHQPLPTTLSKEKPSHCCRKRYCISVILKCHF